MNNYWTESRTKNTCSLYWIYRIISELDTWTKSGHVWKQSFKTMRSAQKKNRTSISCSNNRIRASVWQTLEQAPGFPVRTSWRTSRTSYRRFRHPPVLVFLNCIHWITFSIHTGVDWYDLYVNIYIYNIDIYIKNKNAYIQIACRLLVWANKESNQYNIGQLYHLEIGFVLWAIFGLIRNFTRRDWR